MPHGSGLAQNVSGSARHGLGSEAKTSRDRPPEDGESSQRPGVSPSPGFRIGVRLRLNRYFIRRMTMMKIKKV